MLYPAHTFATGRIVPSSIGSKLYSGKVRAFVVMLVVIKMRFIKRNIAGKRGNLREFKNNLNAFFDGVRKLISFVVPLIIVVCLNLKYRKW